VDPKGLTTGPKFMIDQGCTINTNLTETKTTYFKVEPKALITGPKFMIKQDCPINTPNLT